MFIFGQTGSIDNIIQTKTNENHKLKLTLSKVNTNPPKKKAKNKQIL